MSDGKYYDGGKKVTEDIAIGDNMDVTGIAMRPAGREGKAFFVGPNDPDVAAFLAYFHVEKKGDQLVIIGRANSMDEETERESFPLDKLETAVELCAQHLVAAGKKLAERSRVKFYALPEYSHLL